MRTCGRPFSILINANNELFSVWLGAYSPRRGQPPPDPAYSCTNAIASIPFPRPAISYQPPSPVTPSDSNRSHPRSRDPPIANYRMGLILMKVSRGIDFDGTLVPLFFPTSRSSAAPAFRNPPVSSPGSSDLSLPLSFSLSRSLSLCDEFAELTGYEPVVQKRVNI